jgi:hypothetical protein
MNECQQPERDAGLGPQLPAETQPAPTPGPNIQDVEHDARPETRVDNAGVRVKPPGKSPEGDAAEQKRRRTRDSDAGLGAELPKLPPD